MSYMTVSMVAVTCRTLRHVVVRQYVAAHSRAQHPAVPCCAHVVCVTRQLGKVGGMLQWVKGSGSIN
jgi:hypothetical protein